MAARATSAIAAQSVPVRGNRATTGGAGSLVWHADPDTPLQHGSGILEWDTRRGRSVNLELMNSEGARLWMQVLGDETWLFQQSHKGQRLSYSHSLMHGKQLRKEPSGPFVGVFFGHGRLYLQAYAKDPVTGNPVCTEELDRIDIDGASTLTFHSQRPDRGALTAAGWRNAAVNSVFDLPWSCPP
ncbi:hypothetical protein [Streptomyces sp. NPDC096030]|uniref:hypothetical protein n=1 Tax=Streptomyces sp. NPDC096030 TaxID=3155423 RepID=UPI00332A7C26